MSTIDLSTVAAPEIVETLSFETILAAMLADLQERDTTFTALVESDPAYKILEVAAYRELILRQRVNDACEQVMLAYATGTNLENLGALYGVARLTLTEATEDTAATYETDADFRKRILLALSAMSTAGPINAYKYWALQVDEVKDVSVTSPNPGEVLVTVMGRIGDGSVDQSVVSAVEELLTDDDVRPLTDQVTVQSAEALVFEIEATLFIYDGPDATTVYNNAIASLRAYLDANQIIGRDIPLSGIYAALSVAGVSRVELTSPTATVSVDDTQVAYCAAPDIAHGGIGE